MPITCVDESQHQFEQFAVNVRYADDGLRQGGYVFENALQKVRVEAKNQAMAIEDLTFS